jgi:hypothetical protein
LSSAVEKVCDALVGIVVFLGIILVITPPSIQNCNFFSYC